MKKTNKSNWAVKLTDENVLELVTTLNATKEARKFQKIIKITRTDENVSALYSYRKTNTFLNYAEETLVIDDFKLNGQHKYSLFIETMTKFFGEEYAKDFMAHAEKYIAENDDLLSKKYEKAIKDLKTSFESLNPTI